MTETKLDPNRPKGWREIVRLLRERAGNAQSGLDYVAAISVESLALAHEQHVRDLEALHALIMERMPWAADDNWHKFEYLRTPEVVQALKNAKPDSE